MIKLKQSQLLAGIPARHGCQSGGTSENIVHFLGEFPRNHVRFGLLTDIQCSGFDLSL